MPWAKMQQFLIAQRKHQNKEIFSIAESRIGANDNF